MADVDHDRAVASEPLFTVRMYDRFDGWIDCHGWGRHESGVGVPREQAERVLAGLEADFAAKGKGSSSFEGEYAIFPADTVMWQRPETMDPL